MDGRIWGEAAQNIVYSHIVNASQILNESCLARISMPTVGLLIKLNLVAPGGLGQHMLEIFNNASRY